MADATQTQEITVDGLMKQASDTLNAVMTHKVVLSTVETRKVVTESLSKRYSIFGSVAGKISERVGEGDDTAMSILTDGSYAKGAPSNYRQNTDKWIPTRLLLIETLTSNGMSKANAVKLTDALESATLIIGVLNHAVGNGVKKEEAPTQSLGNLTASLDF